MPDSHDSPPAGRLRIADPANHPEDHLELKYYDMLAVMAATVAVCTNMLVLKVVRIGPFDLGFTTIGPITFGGAVVFFPITYILGDVLTEVYGFRRARRVIWLSFGAQLYAAAMSWAVLAMPSAPEKFTIQQHYEAVFSVTPRIFAASLTAFIVGDFVNSIILARRKVIDHGRAFWKRAILSTIAGQAADSIIFYPLAFTGIFEWRLIITLMFTHYSLKVGIEILGVPLSTWFVNYLKRVEGVDHYDVDTEFNPFGLSVGDQTET